MTWEHDNDCLNGKIVQFSFYKARYFVDNGFLRHIPDPETYLKLFVSWEGVIEKEEPEPWWCVFGKPIFPGACLKQNEVDGQIYLVEGTVKRKIPDACIDKYHFARDEIESATSESLDELIDGLPVFPEP
jgi:hypothetical protein